MSLANSTIRKPLTLVFQWHVKKGKEQLFEQWAHRTTKTASKYPGYQSATWIKPGPNSQHYMLVYSFDTYEHFQKWELSEERKKLLDKVMPLTKQTKPKKIKQLSGIETWFTLPEQVGFQSPPKWKMVIATLLGIYPLVYLVQLFVVPSTNDLPLAIKTLILTGILTPAMTYFIMPNITTLLSPWLYPKK